jgi:acyl-coenzyme A thioesterase PaaI-like protein
MQAPGGPDEDREGGFLHGGWQAPYADDVMRCLVTQGFADADGFLLGRKTYEIFANYWPKVTDPGNAIAAALNSRPKYVVPRSLDRVAWNNAGLIKGDVVAELRRLREQPGRTLQTWGSTQAAADAAEERPDRRVPPVHLPGGARHRQAAVRQGHGTSGAQAGGVGHERQGRHLPSARTEREAAIRADGELVRAGTSMRLGLAVRVRPVCRARFCRPLRPFWEKAGGGSEFREAATKVDRRPIRPAVKLLEWRW